MQHCSRYFRVGFAAIAVLALLTTTARATSTIFFDSFDYPDGPLQADSWGETSTIIASGRVCGDVQSTALYKGPITSDHLRISFEFSAADTSGFEAYVTLQAGPLLYLAGCGGGFRGSGFCTPKIACGAEYDLETAPSIPLAIDTTYFVQAEIDQSTLMVTISDSGHNALGSVTLDTGERFTQVGLLVGRRVDGHLTCADNFRIEDLRSDTQAN